MAAMIADIVVGSPFVFVREESFNARVRRGTATFGAIAEHN